MKSIQLISGSIFAGNPIILRVTPSHISGDDIAFHRIIIKVTASLLIDEVEAVAPVTIPMSVSLFDEEPQDIDISSALRSVLDSYEYIPHPTVYPIVKWQVIGYDEFMQNGILYPPYEEQSFPATVPDASASGSSASGSFAYCLAGSLPDVQRVLLPSIPALSSLSDKPTSPFLYPVTYDYAYTPSLPQPISLHESHLLTHPQSFVERIATEGAHAIAGKTLYALPAPHNDNRQVFRFINRYGVLESISVPRADEFSVAFQTKEYSAATPETFNTIRRGIVHKSNDRETHTFTTDPLTEEWLFWYLHEFFMAKHVWMEMFATGPISGATFIRCHIIPDENIKALKRSDSTPHTLTFTARLDLNGHF